MATDETVTVHPGDIIQDSDGLLYLASETQRWGVGAVLRWRLPDGEVRESYHRMKPGQFTVCGEATLMPEEVRAARRDSIATAKAVAKDAAK